MTKTPDDAQDGSYTAPVLGYTTLRLAIGMSMLIHGVARLHKVAEFTQTTLKMFSNSPLPVFAVAGFARSTPFVELVIGILVVLGFATQLGLTLGGIWMVALIFGSTLIEKYDVVGIQLLYSLIFFVLLEYLPRNALSIDAFINRRNAVHSPASSS